MKRISIYNNYIRDNPTKREQLERKLKDNGFLPTRDGEMTIVIGGDQTFFSAVRKRLDENPLYVGFNAGNLGFLCEFGLNDMDEFIRILKKGEYTIEHLSVYEIRFKDEEGEHIEYFMNDLVIERNSSRILHMGVQVDEEHLCSISGDGIIFSTPIGSTGYSMNTGGAISMEVSGFFQVTPISSVNSKAYRSVTNSMIFQDTKAVTVFPNIKKKRRFRIVCDGRELYPRNTQFLEIRKSEKTVRVMRSKRYSHIKHIQNKILEFE